MLLRFNATKAPQKTTSRTDIFALDCCPTEDEGAHGQYIQILYDVLRTVVVVIKDQWVNHC